MLFCAVACLNGFAPCASALAQAHDKKSVFDTVITRNRGPDRSSPVAGKGAAGVATPSVRQPDAGGWSPQTTSPAPEAAQPVKSGKRANDATVRVRDLRVVVDGDATRVTVVLSAGVRAEIFTLASPYRVIIDLPDVVFALADGSGQTGAGLISAFRFGLFADRKGRVVLDAAGPVRIDGAKMISSGKDGSVTLEMDLVAISAAEFGAGTGAASRAGAAPVSRTAIYDDPFPKKQSSDKPLIMIDPGHGGIDPGAVGVSNVLEKTIVLAVAKKLERRLKATGRYRVEMTRSKDVFVSLDQRVEMSREAGADLFISLHADSIASQTYAPVVRGATVYTLSEKASDEQARLMAEKENASDLVAGIDSATLSDQTEEVRSILIDLIKRETSNFSTDFSNLLVTKLKQSVSLSREPQRSAAFKVLKQTHAPSVLFELGYMSNEADAKLMRQAEWQGKVARSIVAAVDAFFDKRTAKSAP